MGYPNPELLDWRERARSFEGIEFSTGQDFALRGSTSSQWIFGVSVSQGLFDLLGVRPVLGRSGQTATPVAIGIIAGLALAWPATRILKALLFNVTPADPLTFAAAGLVLAGVGSIAAWPARFAARVNPIEVLPSE